MTVRIMLRCTGRDDVVLTLEPGRYARVNLEHGPERPIIAVSALLLEDATGDVTPAGLHIDEQLPAVTEQLGLIGGAR
ncbi:hypothetical protein [Actinoplanes sp. NPDC049118]|uniref:hypothetical protein n=1 Tax=Actinoplanes sp. NPDC049118 TaxID=3155769 RepID=UPI0033ECCAD4